MCPRCRGTLFRERDWRSSYVTCLCCGFVREDDAARDARNYEALEVRWRGKIRRRNPMIGGMCL